MRPSRKPICVLHLRDSPWVDGPGRTILETGVHIDPERVEFHIGALVPEVDAPHPLVNASRERKLHVHAIEDRGGLRNGIVDRIADLIRSIGADVVHTSEFRSNVIGALVARRCDVLHVATVHGWIANDARGRVFRFLDKVLLRTCDRTIFVSHAIRRLVPRWWISDERGPVLHNALVLETYGTEYLDAPRRRAGEDGRINLLKVGRLSPEKGHALLLEAFASVAREHAGLHLLLAGTGPLEGELRLHVARLGLQDRVEFLGFIHDMPSLYARTDLVVQSSYTEGLPNVILEAAYLGVPILATRVGGTDEVIGEGRGGELIAPGSASEIESGIRRFLADPEKYADMAARAREHIVSSFSFQARTERLMRIYEDLV